MSADLRESPYTFGDDGRLFGILTRPGVVNADRPVIVIPNTGIEHRVGPNRLHVQLARALAAAGFCVFRFDISGLGDSDPPRGKSANASDDLKLALDSLGTRVTGAGFVLVGLCSGAHDIHQFGRDDARVRGLLFIDGYTYSTPHFQRLLWTARLTHIGRSVRRLFARLGEKLKPPAEDAPQGVDTDFVVWPPKAETQADYERMLARGAALGFVFTGDTQWAYLYADQHIDAFPLLRGKAQVWFLPHIDHTLTRRKAREELIALVRHWLQGLSG